MEGLRRCDSTEIQGKVCPQKRAGMHRTGSMELKCVGRKAEPDLNDSTPASVVETINKLQYLHSPELPSSKKLGYYALAAVLQSSSLACSKDEVLPFSR